MPAERRRESMELPHGSSEVAVGTWDLRAKVGKDGASPTASKREREGERERASAYKRTSEIVSW